MATGLQFKENLSIISGGYAGEGVGSNGTHTSWTNTTGDSGSSTVTYYYHDSVTASDSNSTKVEVTITDSWTAEVIEGNVYKVTVNTTLGPIKRTKIGSPGAFSVSMRAKRTKNGGNIWSSGGCVNASITHTDLSGTVNMGSYTMLLEPEDSNGRGTVYFRSNFCGHDSDSTPSQYVDEFWLGINFRNQLPKDYIPGALWDGGAWKSHNRKSRGGMVNCKDGGWTVVKTEDGALASGNPPEIVHRMNTGRTWSLDWLNQQLIGSN